MIRDGATKLRQELAKGPLSEKWLKETLSDDRKISRRKNSCEKEGYLWLMNQETGEKELIKTRCKSWDCQVCQASKKSLFSLRMEYGLQSLQDSYFITNTLKKGSRPAKSAYGARLVWTQWLREFRLKFPKLEYMSVIELTQEKTPHNHLVIGWRTPLGVKDNCSKRKADGNIDYKNVMKSKCNCMTHVSSRLLHKITQGETYISFASKTYGAGPGFYLGKYLMKNQDRELMHRMGFKRRWSRSEGWPAPSCGQIHPMTGKMCSNLHLKKYAEGDLVVDGWSGKQVGRRAIQSGTDWKGGKVTENENPEIIGDDLVLTLLEEKRKLRTIIDMEARLAKNNWT